MIGWRDGVLAVALAASMTMTAWRFGATARAQQLAIPCGGETIAHGTVDHVVDGRTFVLTDGREVRLAGVEVPPLSQAPLSQGAGAAPGGTDAKNALDALVGGDDIVLRRAAIPADRYQRLVAYAYAVRDGEELFAQGELIAGGFARVADQVGGRACAADLHSREDAARRAKLGLWADSYYEMLHADDPTDVLAQRGRFALVEGEVMSVHESGATLYMNFGRRWSEDFTVTILKRNERSFAAAGLDVQGLAGRRVRVRGWIEQRGATGESPWIEAAYPEQIEPVGGRE
jgi:endonuclease YncB( thermonuclease family)